MTKSAFYTGQGDHGECARLGGKERIAKNSPAIEALGAIDEASCTIGVVRALLQNEQQKTIILTIQQHLSRLMAHLSASPQARAHHPGLEAADVEWLEQQIAELEIGLPPLKNFVFSGDTLSDGTCHVARAVVRRAERRLITLYGEESSIEPANLAYLNRLSSFLFALALQERSTPPSRPHGNQKISRER